MSFRKLVPVGGTKNVHRSMPAISMTQNSGSGRQSACTRIIVRKHSLNASQDFGWLKAGSTCDIEIGEREHEGILRLSAGRMFRIRKTGGLAKASTHETLMVLAPPLGLMPGEKPSTPCVIHTEESGGKGVLLIELPAWARPQASAGAPPRPVSPDNGGGYRLGAPSHAQVLKGRGVPGA